jgi:peptide deformylase
MTLLKVARMGHPVLCRPAAPVDLESLGSPNFQQLIDDMIETMYDEPGVGLAAPQVHESLRLFVMDPGPDQLPDGPLAIINPVVRYPTQDCFSLWEGCLSVPGIRGLTERRAAVELSFIDRDGEPRQLKLSDFPAAVVQHEADHLDGILFLQRIPDLRQIAHEEEFARFHAEKPEMLSDVGLGRTAEDARPRD